MPDDERRIVSITTRTHRLALGAVGAVIGSFALVGCSGLGGLIPGATPTTTSASPTPSASANPQVCSDAAAAKASLEAIMTIDILKDGTDALNQRFETFRSDAEALVSSAQDEFKPESAAVKASISELETALAALKDSPNAAEIVALAPKLSAVNTSTLALLAAVAAAC